MHNYMLQGCMVLILVGQQLYGIFHKMMLALQYTKLTVAHTYTLINPQNYILRVR